jgi:hypothetical protein
MTCAPAAADDVDGPAYECDTVLGSVR